MQRHAKLALSVWIAVLATIIVFTIFWRVGYAGQQLLWGILSLAATLIPFAWLAASTLWRLVRGPGRLRAIAWLFVGATPLVWIVAYVGHLIIVSHQRAPITLNAPVRVTAIWASSIFGIEAKCRYPAWTRGRHVTLIDDGHSPHPDKLVADMDHHIKAMAKLLGQTVPNVEFPWVRGSIFGFTGRAMYLWAICGNIRRWPDEKSENLCYVDRHEVAHTLITALCGPDQYPPCLLMEGWAESQSVDRNMLIHQLAQARRDGRTLSLQELVEPRTYIQIGQPWAYSEGGPLVLYLMHHYSPATFLRLYADARLETFHDDCRAILGDSWQTVEDGFWKWLEAEDKLLLEAAKKTRNQAMHRVELAKSVDPADWQTLFNGWHNAHKDLNRLPTKAAFVFNHEERIERKTPGNDERNEHELSAIFEDRQFWIIENRSCFAGDSSLRTTSRPNPNLLRDKSGTLLMSTPARNVQLMLGRSEGPIGDGKNAWPHNQAANLIALYRSEGEPVNVTPFRDDVGHGWTWRIEKLNRPAGKNDGTWKLGYTGHYAKENIDFRCQLEVAPAQRWRTTRIVTEWPGKYRTETAIEYANIGDAFLPIKLRTCRTGNDEKCTLCIQGRAMSDTERRELKRRAEQTADQWRPTDSYPWLSRFLMAIVIACPLGGVILLAATQRRKPPPAAAPVIPPAPSA